MLLKPELIYTSYRSLLDKWSVNLCLAYMEATVHLKIFVDVIHHDSIYTDT